MNNASTLNKVSNSSLRLDITLTFFQKILHVIGKGL